jgi:O-antigen/teichoic acid export membrane protein
MSADAGHSGRRLLRNGAVLLVAQVAVTPLAVGVNALMARKLGPSEFGLLYLAGTFVAFAMLFVEWGQGAVLTARAAQQRARAGELLGSSLMFRAAAWLLVSGLMIAVARYVGRDAGFVTILALCALGALFGTLSVACQDVFRGFERFDFAAGSFVVYQYAAALAVVPVLLLGGRLRHVLAAQVTCAIAGCVVVLLALRPLGVPRLSVRSLALRELLAEGTPFLGFGLALVLQPNLDALFMAQWASPAAIGWHAAAKKLIGVLVAPAGAIVGALYPALCRLHAGDPAEYARTARSAFVITGLIATPLALGCALYPELGVLIFSRESFRPAEDNLRVLSLFVFLVYFSMPLGSCLASSGRTRVWSVTQIGCVVISAALCPALIPHFQAHGGNGGLGVCIATVVSEVVMVAIALRLVPKGVLDRSVARRLALGLLSGGAMAATAGGLRWLTPFAAAPLALAAYALCLHWTGGIEPEEERLAFAFIRRKLLRRADRIPTPV